MSPLACKHVCLTLIMIGLQFVLVSLMVLSPGSEGDMIIGFMMMGIGVAMFAQFCAVLSSNFGEK